MNVMFAIKDFPGKAVLKPIKELKLKLKIDTCFYRL